MNMRPQDQAIPTGFGWMDWLVGAPLRRMVELLELASKRHMRPTLTQRRLAMGEAAIYPLDTACSLLPGTSTEAREWLKDRRLVLDMGGVDVVVWREVLAELTGTRDAKKASRPQEVIAEDDSWEDFAG